MLIHSSHFCICLPGYPDEPEPICLSLMILMHLYSLTSEKLLATKQVAQSRIAARRTKTLTETTGCCCFNTIPGGCSCPACAPHPKNKHNESGRCPKAQQKWQMSQGSSTAYPAFCIMLCLSTCLHWAHQAAVELVGPCHAHFNPPGCCSGLQPATGVNACVHAQAVPRPESSA